MSNIVNKANKVPLAAEVNRAQIEHRAIWMGLIYEEMKKAGINDVEGILRRAISRCGEMDGKRFLSQCEDPKDVKKFKEVFLDDTGIETFHMDPKADKDNLLISFHYCALCAGWKKLGFDDETCALLCDIAMDGDRGIAKAMGLHLDLTDTIAKGCPTCELHFHK
jgi:hypothetical protein